VRLRPTWSSWAPGGAQAEYLRVPLADGTLVDTRDQPAADLVPSLLAASDVLGTGWLGAVAAEVGPGKTVAVVGDGAVGQMAVLAASRLGAERIIAMSRHESRQKLALEFGATEIVTERGDAGVAQIKELTSGYGAHSVIEAVGTQESMMQAIRSARPGGHVGYVGVSHGVQLPGEELFYAEVHLHGDPAPVRRPTSRRWGTCSTTGGRPPRPDDRPVEARDVLRGGAMTENATPQHPADAASILVIVHGQRIELDLGTVGPHAARSNHWSRLGRRRAPAFSLLRS
jgi:hypothetical protein